MSDFSVKRRNKLYNKIIKEGIQYSVTKNGVSDEVNTILSYAYNISGEKDFVKTLVAENGTVDPQPKSDIIGANGFSDYGLCQLNRQWHYKFINSEDFKDPFKQIDYCYGVYQDGMKRGIIRTTFYGYNNIHKVEHLLTFNK